MNISPTKKQQIISDIKEVHTGISNRCALNLSFRHGDPLHCQWSSEEEEYLLPKLVSEGLKPVGSIASEDMEVLEAIYIPDSCNKKIVKNRWGMYVLYFWKGVSSFDRHPFLIEMFADELCERHTTGGLYGYSEPKSDINSDMYFQYEINAIGIYNDIVTDPSQTTIHT